MKIVTVPCFIQEGALGHRKIKKLESLISGIYKSHYGSGNRLVFLWTTLPFGQCYLAGQLSNASTVLAPVADNLPAEQRHAFMSEVCQVWQDVTDCSKDEIILVSSDFSAAKAAQATMFSRFGQASRGKSKLKILKNMARGYFSKGYLNASINP